MPRAEAVVQALLPASLHKWLQQQARREGLSVSAWVRELVARERARLIVEAWWRSDDDVAEQPSALTFIPTAGAADFLLERVSEATRWHAMEFRMLNTDGRRTNVDGLDLARPGAFVLRGDPRHWRLRSSLVNAKDRTLHVVLEPDADRAG